VALRWAAKQMYNVEFTLWMIRLTSGRFQASVAFAVTSGSVQRLSTSGSFARSPFTNSTSASVVVLARFLSREARVLALFFLLNSSC
jgi:hypothetical protein